MGTPAEPTEELSPTKRALLALKQLQAKLDALERAQHEPIAIIGIGCRFPGGADHPEAFWQRLRDGVDAITEVPQERWNINAYYDSDPDTPGKMYTRYGGFVPHLQEFDAQFFRISPREALSLDPQQRLLLEVSWEALENAGLAPDKLTGSQTGVFIGICGNDYWHRLLTREASEIDAYLTTGNTHSLASGRLSYIFGFTGPSLSVDTACSSSLVAVHLAITSLRNQECDLALAGGVNRILTPQTSINFSKARMLSPEGRCKTFDAAANGFVRAEGCGVIVLKRLSDAVASGDNILAVIYGSAVNQDGRTSGLTVPNGPSQEAVIRQALNNSQIEPTQVSYIETHGTGTFLGDPIEIRALGAVFGQERSCENRLIVSSVKTNIGHLEAAAGIAGLIKVVLALQYEEIPPHLHFDRPNPHINWEELPIEVPTQRIPWKSDNKPRIAGVSSFGFSGTNAHVVLAEAPLEGKSKPLNERPLHLLTLSAKSEKALRELAQRYEVFLREHPCLDIGDICFTANTGRSPFNHRLSILAASTSELQEKLASFTRSQDAAGILQGRVKETNTNRQIAFLFAGQGGEYVGRGRQLYETQPTFRVTFDRCNEIFRSYLDKSLLEVLFHPLSGHPHPLSRPALFALEYSLAQLWKSWGIEPSAVIGYGVGECVAATLAGVFSLEDGLKLMATRSDCGEIVNEPMLADFEAVTQTLSYSKPQIPLISPVTGEIAQAEIATPDYWVRYLKEPVRFAAGMKTLPQAGYEIYIEIGPQPILAVGNNHPKSVLWLPSLGLEQQESWPQILRSLAQLYMQGVSIDWSGFDRGYSRYKVILPTYPFQRQRYWLTEGS